MIHLDYEQVFQLQALNRNCYEFAIPRFLNRDEATVKPQIVLFDFSTIKQQQKPWLKEKYSSEAKSSDDELGRQLLYA